MGITDCHVHINPLWEMLPHARALLGTSGPGEQIERYLHDPQLFLNYLDSCGIDRAVLVNYVSPQVVGYTERANEFVAEYVRADPQRLIAVGSVLPSHPNPGDEVRRLVDELGIRALKIHPPHQLFAPNGYVDGSAPGLRAIYSACEERGIPVIFHTGTSVFPNARNRFGQPMLVEDVAIDFPNLTIVLAHGGRPLWTAEAMFLARRFERVYLELSSVPPAKLLEYFPGLERLAPKLLFGTDWPGPGVKDIGENLRAFQALPVSREVQEAILLDNPERVFPRVPPS
ncbi:MAG: amidohydrolase family protein [Thermoplasmata archaeon]|nr:amidohydrolase family protein [Thermoplasmata archaeon]